MYCCGKSKKNCRIKLTAVVLAAAMLFFWRGHIREASLRKRSTRVAPSRDLFQPTSEFAFERRR